MGVGGVCASVGLKGCKSEVRYLGDVLLRSPGVQTQSVVVMVEGTRSSGGGRADGVEEGQEEEGQEQQLGTHRGTHVSHVCNTLCNFAASTLHSSRTWHSSVDLRL